MSLDKAYLTFIEPSSTGGKPGGAVAVNGRGKLEFQFNPKEYTVAKTAEWKRKSTAGAKTTSPPQFTGSGPRTLSLELFLDATERGGDVSEDVDVLFACLVPDPTTLSKKKPSPPFVQFGWGGRVLFVAILKQVSAKFTMFRPNGAPIRAACTVSLEEYGADDKRQNPTSGGLEVMRTHTMVAGDTLQSVAHREYDDPTLWRVLAEVNGVDDPFRLPPGTPLRVPMAYHAEPGR
ncbi:MAG: peptidase M23 [Micromonosporaceae bacterium]|nr:peptidase M23 [Micromonosporaceae bacterium]